MQSVRGWTNMQNMVRFKSLLHFILVSIAAAMVVPIPSFPC